MFSTKTKVILSALTALVVVGLIVVLLTHSKQTAGAVSTLGVSGTPTVLPGGSVPSLFSALEASESFISDGISYVITANFLGGTTAATAVRDYPIVGACNTATSTLFSVVNPTGATSTVIFGQIAGTNSAQIDDIVVGTTTATAAVATTTKSTVGGFGAGYIFGLPAVAASAQFFSVMGIGSGMGDGLANYLPPLTGPYAATSTGIVLGPTDRLTGYSTSTSATGGNGVTSCIYKFVVRN